MIREFKSHNCCCVTDEAYFLKLSSRGYLLQHWVGDFVPVKDFESAHSFLPFKGRGGLVAYLMLLF